jgi:glycogen debranching enzyme
VTTPLTPSGSMPTMDRGALQQVHGTIFSIAASDGDMSGGLHGLYCADTRVASVFCLRVDGRTPEVISVQQLGSDRLLVLSRVTPRPGVQDSEILVERERWLDGALDETVRLRYFGSDPLRLPVQIEVGADFADLFAVKEGRVAHPASLPAQASGVDEPDPAHVAGLPVVCRFTPPPSSQGPGRGSVPHLLVAADGHPSSRTGCCGGP